MPNPSEDLQICRPSRGDITPPLRRLLKKSHRGSALKITPPLRGSHRDRAVCAKVDVVGGESRFIATPSYTPHQFTFGLTPSVHCRAFPSGCPTLKGGVIFLSRRSGSARRGGPPWPPVDHIHPDTGQARGPVPTESSCRRPEKNKGFFNRPCQGGLFFHPLVGGHRLYFPDKRHGPDDGKRIPVEGF